MGLTNADPGAAGWGINDPVIRFRVIGTLRVFDLESSERWILGSSPECSIHLDDPFGRVSRCHAVAVREGEIWTMQDLGSTNGIRVNGEDRRTFQFAPGDEIDLGGITLIVESHRSMELYLLLRRWLGWSARWLPTDRAFREVREMAHGRAALILRGAGSLVGVARRLHRLTLGDQPFVVLGRDESARQALDRTAGGMLCVEARHRPRDLDQLVAGRLLSRNLDQRVAGISDPQANARIVVCAERAREVAELAAMLPRVTTIWIPPIAEREDEIDRMLEAYGRDAMAELGATDLGFRPLDPKWVRASGVATLAEIEDVARRLVALRNWGVTHGAERLGITHGALSRWARRRKIPTIGGVS